MAVSEFSRIGRRKGNKMTKIGVATYESVGHSADSTSRDISALKIYLSEIDQVPLLSRNEERGCLEKAKDGDSLAREKLIKSNLRFVVSVAKKYRGSGLPLEDLINEGNIGLMIAIEKYDLSKKYHFITYAVWWIRQSILKAIADKSRIIRIPSNKGIALSNLERACESRRDFFSFYSDQTLREIAEELHTNESTVKELITMSHVSTSFDDFASAEEKTVTLGSRIPDDESEAPEDAVSRELLSKEIDNALHILTQRESEVLQLRFGLNGRLSLSLTDIGILYNVTKERIRQIEVKALQKLRNWTGNVRLKSFQT